MRVWVMIVAAAALTGCTVHDGKNVNYQMGADTPYDQYRRDREVALTTGTQPPRRVPVALPLDAPTVEDITWKAPPRTARVRAVPVAGEGTALLTRFAFAAQHAPGTQVWPRPNASAAQAARVCARYATADQAQLAFLAAGGPERDRYRMDPDGDGFVCGWNPAPWRQSPL